MTKPGYRYPGKTGAVMDAEHKEKMDVTVIRTACAFCPWTVTTTAAEGRLQAAQHRATAHPDVRATRRRRGSLQRWAVSDDSFKAEGDANAAEVAAMLAKRDEEAA